MLLLLLYGLLWSENPLIAALFIAIGLSVFSLFSGLAILVSDSERRYPSD